METGQKDKQIVSLTASVAVCVPAFCLAAWVVETRSEPIPAWTVIPCVLALAVVNFLLVVALEFRKSKIGPWTIDALLASIGVVLLFVIAGALDRFVHDVGWDWLMPVALAYLAFSAFAVFKEHRFVLKCVLGFNAVALAALWGVGTMGKVMLPF